METDLALSWEPFWLTARLAGVVTILLLIIGTPIAWWLSLTSSRFKPIVEAFTALPLVLPPTVIGFYFLVFMNPTSPLGALWIRITGDTLTFSFSGLVVASLFYSLPFAVQPLQSAFEAVGEDMMETAESLRAGPFDAFFSVMVPLSVRGYLTAAVLTFAHTIGEFGVVLMVGGNIPNETRVVSIAIYEHVETLNYHAAHLLSIILIIFSFAVLVSVYALNRRYKVYVG